MLDSKEHNHSLKPFERNHTMVGCLIDCIGCDFTYRNRWIVALFYIFCSSRTSQSKTKSGKHVKTVRITNQVESTQIQLQQTMQQTA